MIYNENSEIIRICPKCYRTMYYSSLEDLKRDILSQTVCLTCTARGWKHPRYGDFSNYQLNLIASEPYEVRELSHDILEVVNNSNQSILRLRNEGHSMAEIARALGVSRQAVHSRLKRNK